MKMIPKYEYIDDEETLQCHIKLTSGKYEGLRFYYGKAKFDELGDGTAKLKFNYYVVDNPNGYEYDQELEDVLGDVLVNILDEELAKGENETN